VLSDVKAGRKDPIFPEIRSGCESTSGLRKESDGTLIGR
jgi:hypothetical protein